jgi:DNA repair protein RecO (recombination protein O)
MEWQDRGIVLATRRHGETSVIAEMMTQAHGRHIGLVRGGRSRRMQPVLQPGNVVALTWRARIDEHLGQFRVEPINLRAGRLMETATSIYGVQAMAALLRFLPERDPHGHLYEAFDIIVDHLDNPAEAGELFVRFEIAMLDELGFGLDLSACAATGTTTDLVYVSPKSGRAVSRVAGAAYAARMLALPAFLTRRANQPADPEALRAAFAMTGHFLQRDVYGPRGASMADARAGFVAAAIQAAASHHSKKDAIDP